MTKIIKQKPIIGLFAGLLVGAVVGIALVSVVRISDDSNKTNSLGDRFMLVTGESLVNTWGGEWEDPVTEDMFWEEIQPLSLDAARSLRWKKDVKCVPGIGYYSRRAAANDKLEPYSLIFDNLERVVGVYIYSENEQQSPWGYREATGPYLYPHWGLHLFFLDSTNACS